MGTDRRSTLGEHVQVRESSNPLAQHWLAVARDKETRHSEFKKAIQNITRIFLYECAERVIPTCLTQAVEAEMPISVTYHVGYVRNEETLEATPYLNKLPASFNSSSKILLLDIMIATGGTICQVLDELLARGASPTNITVLCVVAATPALDMLNKKYEGVGLVAAAFDPQLNERGYIVPGLGDAGDRSYGTL